MVDLAFKKCIGLLIVLEFPSESLMHAYQCMRGAFRVARDLLNLLKGQIKPFKPFRKGFQKFISGAYFFSVETYSSLYSI